MTLLFTVQIDSLSEFLEFYVNYYGACIVQQRFFQDSLFDAVNLQICSCFEFNYAFVLKFERSKERVRVT